MRTKKPFDDPLRQKIMRTETRTYNVYKVDELSFTAKENAYNRWLAGYEYPWTAKENAYNRWLAGYEYPWQSENMATLKAFEGIFNIRVCDWRYDGCTCYYRFTSNYSEEEEGLCGVRLLKFIVNNYWHSLFKPKTYWHGKDFNKHDKHTNLHDLMDECIGSFFRFCSRDVEDCTDEEAFEHDCEANGYEFLSDGTLFN